MSPPACVLVSTGGPRPAPRSAVAAAVALIAVADAVHVALNRHAAWWLSRRAWLETLGLAALDWWAGKAE